MAEFLQFLTTYGYVVIFVWVLLDQAGLPLPAVPLLLAAGALVRLGELSALTIFAITLAAALPVDLFWYQLGKKRGGKVLNLLCAISLEPDYCVRNTESTFDRLGPYSLLIAKFVPGLQTLAPPMSGLAGMSMTRFLALDTIGTLSWTAVFLGIGYLFADQLESVAMILADFGLLTAGAAAIIVAFYFSTKLWQRTRFLKTLNMRRLKPAEAFDVIQNNDNVHVIDLRHS